MKFLSVISKRGKISWLAVVFLAAQLLPSLAVAAVPTSRTFGNLLDLDLKVLVAGKPIYLILVEKDFQRLRVLEHDGRLNVVAEYFAITGENFGRKQIEGDSKTPEGVYFITKSYVDKEITLFGKRAFHLNYPNSYDQSDGRNGNGIYVHGTNRELRSNSTNGCITLNNNDLDDLAQYLSVGSIPVIIVSSLYDEVGSKGLYPDLTEDDFSLAKELLILASKPDDFEFVSLYLIRAVGQTVAAGEYKAGKIASQSLYSAAYLDITQKKGWFVVERGPGSDTVKTASEEVVSAVEDVAAKTQKTSFLAPEAWSELWEPKKEDIYLNWYRDSISKRETIVETLVNKAQETRGLSMNEQSSGSKMTYVLIILAACITIGSVLVLKWAKPSTVTEDTKDKADGYIRFTAENLADEQHIESIQDELGKAKESLRLVQDHMQEEKSLMEKDLQSIIEELEIGLRDKQAEIDQLATEKAALKLKGMSHMSGQVEELTTLNIELKEAKGQLEEARKDSARSQVLESMITAQKEETNRLAAENAAWKMNEAETDASRKSDIQTFQNQLAFLETQLQGEVERRKLSESKVLVSVDMNKELSAAKAETDQLRQKLLQHQAADPQSEFEQEISTLRGRVSVYKTELSSEREKREILSAQLDAAQGTEQTISAHKAVIEQLENENSRLKERELSAKRDQNEELAAQLKEAPQLEEKPSASKADLDKIQTENKVLRETADRPEENEELAALRDQLAEQTDVLNKERNKYTALENRLSRLNELEEFVLARQVEVTSLTNELEALKTKDHSSSEQIFNLQSQLDALQETLESERAQRLEVPTVSHSEQAVMVESEPHYADKPQPQEQFGPKQDGSVEIVKRVDPVPELAKTSADEDLLSHGTQFLPEDILKKWVGQS